MWKEYYILGNMFGRRWQLINYWHLYKWEGEFHLLSIYRQWRGGGWEYNFALLGFRLRTFITSEQRYKKRNKLK